MNTKVKFFIGSGINPVTEDTINNFLLDKNLLDIKVNVLGTGVTLVVVIYKEGGKLEHEN